MHGKTIFVIITLQTVSWIGKKADCKNKALSCEAAVFQIVSLEFEYCNSNEMDKKPYKNNFSPLPASNNLDFDGSQVPCRADVFGRNFIPLALQIVASFNRKQAGLFRMG